jgi:ABC-2 type transport system ATP-binding protein
MADSAVIAALDARISVDGAVAIDRLTLVTQGDRVVLAGDPAALLAAITGASLSPGASIEDDELPGEAYVIAGSLLVAGRDVASGAHTAAIGAALLDPPLPPSWSAEEYVTWGARLGGAPRRAARELAAQAIARVGLFAVRKRAASGLSIPERRALCLAQAAVLSPEVLIAEAPLSGLSGDAAALVIAALGAVTEGRRAVITASRLDPASPEGALCRGADHLIVLAGGEVALEGPPGELFAGARVYSLMVSRNATLLQAELASRGIDLRGGPIRFSAALPEGTSTRDILLSAQAANAAVVELVPVIG